MPANPVTLPVIDREPLVDASNPMQQRCRAAARPKPRAHHHAMTTSDTASNLQP